ncbi:hypothetical protein Tco_0999683 [Tanacetum coccineum]
MNKKDSSKEEEIKQNLKKKSRRGKRRKYKKEKARQYNVQLEFEYDFIKKAKELASPQAKRLEIWLVMIKQFLVKTTPNLLNKADSLLKTICYQCINHVMGNEALASPNKQTVIFGKDKSNPLMVDSLPKTVW